MALVHRVPRRREALGLHADDAQVGADRLRRRRHAGDQPAAADRDDEGVDRRLLGEHLERDGALAGDDREVVERMDDRRAALGGEPEAVDAGVLEGVALEHDLGAEAARVLDLDARREARHHDRRRDAHPLGVVRDRLRVVARRDGEHATGALGRRQLRHLVERAALLERCRELQVLELEKDLATADLRQRSRREARRLDDLAAQPLGGGANVVDRQRRGRGAHRAIVAASRRRPTEGERPDKPGVFPIPRTGTAAAPSGLKRADNDRQKLTSLPLCLRRRGDRFLARTRRP
jgi:hypothetical protein